MSFYISLNDLAGGAIFGQMSIRLPFNTGPQTITIPAEGATVRVYERGTTTPVDVYSTDDGSGSVATQPLDVDQDGSIVTSPGVLGYVLQPAELDLYVSGGPVASPRTIPVGSQMAAGGVSKADVLSLGIVPADLGAVDVSHVGAIDGVGSLDSGRHQPLSELAPGVVLRTSQGPEFYDSFAPYVAKANGALTKSDSGQVWTPFASQDGQGLRIMTAENGVQGVLTAPRPVNPGDAKGAYAQTVLSGPVTRLSGRVTFPPWTGDPLQGACSMLSPSSDYANSYVNSGKFLPTTTVHFTLTPNEAQLDFLISAAGISAVKTDNITIYLSPGKGPVLQPNVEYHIEIFRYGSLVALDIIRTSDGQSMLGGQASIQMQQDLACSTINGNPVVTDAAIHAANAGAVVTGAGIPTGSPVYVGTVVDGTSFRLSSSPNSQVDVNANATASGVALTINNSQSTIISAGSPVIISDPRFAQAGNFAIWETFNNGNPDFTNGSQPYFTEPFASSSLQEGRDGIMAMISSASRASNAAKSVEASAVMWATTDGNNIVVPTTTTDMAAVGGNAANFAIQPTSQPGVTVTIATPGVVTLVAHGLTAGDAVIFATTGALPTGITAGTTYYVLSDGNLTANTFDLATTPGGTAINTTGSQSGTHTLTNTSLYVPVVPPASGNVKVTIQATFSGSNGGASAVDIWVALRNGATTMNFTKVASVPANIATTPAVPGTLWTREPLTFLLTGLTPANGFTTGQTYNMRMQVKATTSAVAQVRSAYNTQGLIYAESVPQP